MIKKNTRPYSRKLQFFCRGYWFKRNPDRAIMELLTIISNFLLFNSLLFQPEQ